MGRLSPFQRVAVVLGFLCLGIALVGLLDTERPERAAAIAFVGLCWLIGSRLTYRDDRQP